MPLIEFMSCMVFIGEFMPCAKLTCLWCYLYDDTDQSVFKHSVSFFWDVVVWYDTEHLVVISWQQVFRVAIQNSQLLIQSAQGDGYLKAAARLVE